MKFRFCRSANREGFAKTRNYPKETQRKLLQ